MAREVDPHSDSVMAKEVDPHSVMARDIDPHSVRPGTMIHTLS